VRKAPRDSAKDQYYLTAPQISMTTRASAGRIETNDVEELQRVVQPWEVVLRQISSGRLHARMDYVQVNGIVLYREHWSRRILATGATPRGYFFFGAPTSSHGQVGWCGTQIGAECLAFGRSSSAIDFVTADAETHVCLLVPDDLMRRYLGEEFVVRGLPSEPFLACARGCGAQLLRMMERILDKYFVHRDLLANERACQAIEWQLMGGAGGVPAHPSRAKRSRLHSPNGASPPRPPRNRVLRGHKSANQRLGPRRRLRREQARAGAGVPGNAPGPAEPVHAAGANEPGAK
jgi:hypothetical protein